MRLMSFCKRCGVQRRGRPEEAKANRTWDPLEPLEPVRVTGLLEAWVLTLPDWFLC